MIDPKEILGAQEEQTDSRLTDIEGSFGCPEQGCYEYTYQGKFNGDTRQITWVCSNGHKGSATL